jgi:alpha-tubulin suppressor-like RCC1 family protein
MTNYFDRTPSNYKVEGGRLFSTGYGQAGILGDFTSGTNRFSPVLVVGGYEDWKYVAASYHALGIKHDGTMFTWGYNNHGQLGDGALLNKSSPVQLGSNTDWMTADVGYVHSAAIKTNGTIWCWGNNTFGQCGTNDVTHRSSPVQEVLANTNWKAIACGWYHTVALQRNGSLWSWGENDDGQLAKNDVVHRSSPVQELTGNTNWKIISAGGYHTYAIKTDGTLWGWGDGSNGRLGEFSVQLDRSSPVQTALGGNTWSAISLGKHHNIALKTDGTLWAWGRGTDGQLGWGGLGSRSSPVQDVTNGTDWKIIHAYGWNSAAIKNDGSLWTWGDGSTGANGNDDAFDQPYPDEIPYGKHKWKAIAGGGETLFALEDASIDAASGEMAEYSEPELWGWGWNPLGGLGDNSTTNKSSPLQIDATNKNWRNIGKGSQHTVGIRTDETLWAWGGNTWGQLGDNTTVDKSTPVQNILLDTNWKQAAAGWRHSVALKTDGTLWSWGHGTSGQLGKGDQIHRSSPAQIGALTTWKAVACGNYFTVGLTTGGTIWAWGNNTQGALGQSDIVHRSSPLQIGSNTSWKRIACGGFHVLSIKTDGTLWAWGSNLNGRLGDNTETYKSSPVQEISGGTNWKNISAAQWASFGIKMDGTLWSWGHNGDPAGGTLGRGDLTHRSSPAQIGALTNWKDVSGNRDGAIAIRRDGTLWSWGNNTSGQVGDNTVIHRSSPVQTIAGGTDWTYVSQGASSFATFGIRDRFPQRATNGLVTQEYLIDVYPSLSQQFKQAGLWGWGDNTNGELGDGSITHRSSPVQTIAGGTNWLSGGSSLGHTAVVKSDGTLWSWGRGASGQLGDNTNGTKKSSPVQEILANTLWKMVAVGAYHSVALRTNGTIWGWGLNDVGQLGINSVANKSSPVQEILASTLWKTVSAGGYHSAALRTNGTLWTWGFNGDGQLGNNAGGVGTSKSSPVQEVTGGTTWKTLACGGYHTLAIKSDGTLWNWGKNVDGQLGDNSVTHRSSPVQTTAGGTTWKTVAGGGYHSIAIKTDGSLWTWGGNYRGKLGDGTQNHRSSPVQTITGGTNWKKAIGGHDITAALKIDGSLWAWGSNEYGQLAQDDLVHRSSPVIIGTSYNWIELVGNGRAYRILAIRDDSEDTL